MYKQPILWLIATLMSSIPYAYAGRPSSPAPQQQPAPAPAPAPSPPTSPSSNPSSPPPATAPQPSDQAPSTDNNDLLTKLVNISTGQEAAILGTIGTTAAALALGREYLKKKSKNQVTSSSSPTKEPEIESQEEKVVALDQGNPSVPSETKEEKPGVPSETKEGKELGSPSVPPKESETKQGKQERKRGKQERKQGKNQPERTSLSATNLSIRRRPQPLTNLSQIGILDTNDLQKNAATLNSHLKTQPLDTATKEHLDTALPHLDALTKAENVTDVHAIEQKADHGKLAEAFTALAQHMPTPDAALVKRRAENLRDHYKAKASKLAPKPL